MRTGELLMVIVFTIRNIGNLREAKGVISRVASRSMARLKPTGAHACVIKTLASSIRRFCVFVREERTRARDTANHQLNARYYDAFSQEK